MADEKSKPKTKRRLAKKPETLRERAEKHANKKPSRKRKVKATFSATAKPFSRFWRAGTAEYHIIKPRKGGFMGFLTKPRRFIPRYFRDSFAELKKVTWPDNRTTWKLVFAVIVFALIFGSIIALLDFGLEKIFRRLLLS